MAVPLATFAFEQGNKTERWCEWTGGGMATADRGSEIEGRARSFPGSPTRHGGRRPERSRHPICSAIVHAIEPILTLKEGIQQWGWSSGGKTMNRQQDQACMRRLNRRLTIDGTPVISRYFKLRPEGPGIAARVERVTDKSAHRPSGR